MTTRPLNPSARRNLLLDLGMTPLFIGVFLLGEHGTLAKDSTLHQVFSLVFGITLALHLAWHGSALRRLPSMVFRGRIQVRLNAVVDLLLVGVLLLTMITGIAISSWITGDPDGDWVHLHHILPKFMLLGLAVHVALHWRWIVTNASSAFDLLRGYRK